MQVQVQIVCMKDRYVEYVEYRYVSYFHLIFRGIVISDHVDIILPNGLNVFKFR